MIEVSDAFLRTLRGSHPAVYRARFLDFFQTGPDPVGTEGQIIAGTVRLDGTADERGALDLTVPGQCGEWPDNQFEPIAPFGQEVFVERGIGNLVPAQEVASLPAGIIVGWPSTAASIPDGWFRVGLLDEKFPKGVPNGLTDPGTTGGASTHTHDPAGHTHTIGTHVHAAGTPTGPSDFFARNGAVASVGNQLHTHSGNSSASTDNTSSTDPAVNTASNLPAWEDVVWIQSDGTTDGIPDGAIAWFDDTSVPAGWTQHAAGNGRYVKGAAAGADGGTTGGANTHTHTSPDHTHTTTHGHPATASGGPSATSNYVAGALATASGAHTHQITHASTASGASGNGQLAFSTDSNEPPYYTLALAENTSGGELGTVGLIVVWLGGIADIPDGWALCDGTNGTPDLTSRFIKNATTLATDVGDTGGGDTHSHTGVNHSHSVPSHLHSRSYGAPSATVNAGATGGSNNSTSGTHTHAAHNSATATGTTGNAAPAAPSSDNQPPFIEVAFIMLVSTLPAPYTEPCAPEYVALGYFRIETVEQDDAPDSAIRITGRDRMAAIIEARMLEPRTFDAGTRFDEIFENLVLEVYPAAVMVIDDDVAGSTLREAATVEEDRYGFLRDLATSRGRIMYFNREGELVVTTAPDSTAPVWTVNEGPDGVLVSLRRQLSRSGVYNAVVARGTEADEAGGDPPGYAAVWDDNPNSATYFFGLFGKVPRFYASPFIYTDAQATSAAESILSQTTGLPYSLDLTAIPNPALEPLDPITVAFERTAPEGCEGETLEEIHVIDSMTIPLSAEQAMTMNTRSQVEFIAGQVEE
jgi:hypothetical protein